MQRLPLLALGLLPFLGSCDSGTAAPAEETAPTVPRGAPIDGGAQPTAVPVAQPEEPQAVGASHTPVVEETAAAARPEVEASDPGAQENETPGDGEVELEPALEDESAGTVTEAVTTESLLAKDYLTFGDLALGDESLDQLLDVLLALEDFPEEPFEFPEAIQGLEGKKITILGYMIPTQWEDSKVSNFMLVGDLLACCFGGTPLPDAWIDVTMEDDGGTKYLPYTPVLCTGTFHISSEMPENGYFVGVYRMDGIEVVRQP